MAGSTIPSPQFKGALIEKDGTAAGWFIKWVNLVLLPRVQAQAPSVIPGVELDAQNAAIGVTSLIASAQPGLYRVSWWLRVVTAAGVSSSIQVNIHSTDGTIAVTESGVAQTGNTTATTEGTSVIMRCDAGSPLSYSTTYASNPANAAEYDLDIQVEML